MNNKTCGECKHFYISDEETCSLTHELGFTDSDACPNFKSTIATNGDRIRQMSNEELADILSGGCSMCVYDSEYCMDNDSISCEEGRLAWLNAPAESEVEDE